MPTAAVPQLPKAEISVVEKEMSALNLKENLVKWDNDQEVRKCSDIFLGIWSGTCIHKAVCMPREDLGGEKTPGSYSELETTALAGEQSCLSCKWPAIGRCTFLCTYLWQRVQDTGEKLLMKQSEQ